MPFTEREKELFQKAHDDSKAQFDTLKDVIKKDDWAKTIEVNEGEEVVIPGIDDPATELAFERMCLDV